MSNKKISQTAANCHFTTIVLFRMVLSSVLCVWDSKRLKTFIGKLNTSFQDGSVNPSVKFIQRHSTYSLDTSSFFLLFYFAHSAAHKNFFCLLFSSVYIIICMCMEAGVGKKVINFRVEEKTVARSLACLPAIYKYTQKRLHSEIRKTHKEMKCNEKQAQSHTIIRSVRRYEERRTPNRVCTFLSWKPFLNSTRFAKQHSQLQYEKSTTMVPTARARTRESKRVL